MNKEIDWRFVTLNNWMIRRTNKKRMNKNVICVIIGPTGSGKSYTGLSFGEYIRERTKVPFSIENNVDFSFSGLLNKMMMKENSKPGTPFVFEEVGAIESGASNRQWQSKANLFFTSFLQTNRHRNQILFMTLPVFSSLDVTARNLVHLLLEQQGVPVGRCYSVVKPLMLQLNFNSGKIYSKYPRIIIEGVKKKIKFFHVPKPSEEILKDYEAEKLKFTTMLNKKIMEDGQVKKKPYKFADQELVMEMHMKEFNNTKIAKILGITPRTVYNCIKRYELAQNDDNLLRKSA